MEPGSESGSSQRKRFENKVVLIAGSSSGIGRVAAKRFALEGARVAVVGSASLEKAAAVVAEIEQAGGEAGAFVADLRDVDAIQRLVNDVVARFAGVDVLVNSAGAHFATYIGDTTEEQFDILSDINLKGAYFLMNAVAPVMKRRQAGKIVNVSAEIAHKPMSGMAIYCATKAALETLTATMAWELGPYGINCNAVAPGNTITPEHMDMMGRDEFSDVIEYFQQSTPSPRKVSMADDIANLILFLASEEANSVYGETLIADEGISRASNGFLPSGVALFADFNGKRRTRED